MARWWDAFDDPVLVSLVERAFASNLDLKLAESRILQARAARGISAAGLGACGQCRIVLSGAASHPRAEP